MSSQASTGSHPSSRQGRLARNTGLLFGMQLVNQLLPLLLIPYLTQVLGLELFGVLAFGLVLQQLACLLTDFGFSLSLTARIARQRDDQAQLGRLVSAAMLCKLALIALVSLGIGLLLLTPVYTEHRLLLILMLLPIAGQSLQPLWLLQGLEKMASLTLTTLAGRLLYLALVLLMVQEPEDYTLAALAQGAGQWLSALLGLGLMLRLGLRPCWPGLPLCHTLLQESWGYFCSRAAVATYTSGAAFLLGLIGTPTQMGLYVAAEQLYRGAQSLYAPLCQALYPLMARHADLLLFRRLLGMTLLTSGTGVAIGFWIAPAVIELLYGPEFDAAYPVLALFMLTFLFSAPSQLLGYPLLGVCGEAAYVNTSVLLAGALQLSLLLVCSLLGANSAVQIASTVLLAEATVLCLRAHRAYPLLSGRRPPTPAVTVADTGVTS